jgi:hypothetical protein
MEKLKGFKTDLVVSGGDNTNEGTFLGLYEVFKGYPTSIPFVSVIGNHDAGSKHYKEFFPEINHYL